MYIFYLIISILTATIDTLSVRMTDGHDTAIEKHPYQVFIEVDGVFTCEGTIISLLYVLTPAQCVFSGIEFIVKSGTNNRHSGKIHKIDKVILHEAFKFGENGYDIALLQLRIPFEFDKTHKSIELFNYGEEAKPGTSAILTGWGFTSRNSSDYSEILQEMSLPIVDKIFCKAKYEGKIKPGEICAGGIDFGNTCYGDIGDPLTIGGRLAGIASWGHGFCENSDYPSVYTEIAYYRQWIDEYAA